MTITVSRLQIALGLSCLLLAVGVTPAANAAAPAPGDAVIASQDYDAESDGAIISVNAAGVQNEVSTNDISQAAGGARGFASPFGVAVEANGNIIVGDQGPDLFQPDGRVVRVDPSNGRQTVLAQGGNLVDPMGIAVVHTAAGSLQVGDILIPDESTGDPGGFGDGAIIKVDPVTGVQTLFSVNSISVAAGGESSSAIRREWSRRPTEPS